MKPVTTRLAVPSDHAFIYSTFLHNRWFSRDNHTTLHKGQWYKLQHARLEKMLDTQPTYVVCLSHDHDTILAYSLMDGSTQFTYVKKSWREEPAVQQALKEIKL